MFNVFWQRCPDTLILQHKEEPQEVVPNPSLGKVLRQPADFEAIGGFRLVSCCPGEMLLYCYVQVNTVMYYQVYSNYADPTRYKYTRSTDFMIFYLFRFPIPQEPTLTSYPHLIIILCLWSGVLLLPNVGPTHPEATYKSAYCGSCSKVEVVVDSCIERFQDSWKVF